MDNNYNQQSNDTWQQGNPYEQPMPRMDGSYGGAYIHGSASDPQKAPNVFQQFVLSFLPPQYVRLIRVRTGSMIGFVTLLALIATIISYVDLVSVLMPGIGFGGNTWLDGIPDFAVVDGKFAIEEDFTYEESGMFVYLTDSINGFSYDDTMAIAGEGYRNMILAGRDKLSVLQNGQFQQFDFRNLRDDIELSKDWLVNTIMPILMILITLCYIIFFGGRILWYFLCAAIYLLIALIIAGIMHKQLPGGALYRAAVYSKVPMFVISTLLSVIPLGFSVPLYLRIVITLIFMGVAVAQLPDRA